MIPSLKRPVVVASLLVVASLPQVVYGYRPFDSTDAAVVARGEIEIEIGPFGYLLDADRRFFVVPATILNVGVADDWEVVLEGRQFLRLRATPEDQRLSLGDTALSVKGVLRRGGLQGRRGPSIATEIGVLLPTIGAEPGTGSSVAAIVSQRWSNVTLHVNGGMRLTRAHALGSFAGTIVEGPSRWVVRPVAEVVIEHEPGKDGVAGLIGGIWQVREHFALDVGLRVGASQGNPQREMRAGLSWVFGSR